MKECKGLLPAFGVSCAPPSERKTRPALLVHPHPVATLWHRTLASMAACHRMGRRGEPRVSEPRQRFCQRGGQALLQRGTEGGDPLEMPPPRGPCVEGRLGLPAPLASRLDLLHARPQRLSLGAPPAAALQGLPCGLVQVTRDAPKGGRPHGVQRPLVWRVPLGLVTTPRTRVVRV